jgi:hypothetical protein
VSYVLENLSWPKQLTRWTDEQQKVLIALSHDRWRWRTKEGLLGATGLDRHALDEALAGLIQEGVVRPSLSRSGDLIYALADRLEE